MLIDINKIKVNNRIRKDYGNITELAQSIERLGLMNPPVVDPEYNLIAGERRLKACKELNMNQIEVNVMIIEDYEQSLMMEIEENENRKEFTFSERMNYAKLIEEVEKLKAKENMIKGGQGLPTLGSLNTNETVADKSGFGGKETFRKAKFIAENADEELIKDLDEKAISINKAYQKLKQEKDDILKSKIEDKQKYTNRLNELEKYNNQLKVKSELDSKDIALKIKRLEEDKVLLERKVKLNEKEVQQYNELKKSIEQLKLEKTDLSRQIEAVTSISGLVIEVENLIKTKLAPIKYSKAIVEQKDDMIVQNNLKDIVNRIQDWCDEMYSLINNNYINVEVIK